MTFIDDLFSGLQDNIINPLGDALGGIQDGVGGLLRMTQFTPQYDLEQALSGLTGSFDPNLAQVLIDRYRNLGDSVDQNDPQMNLYLSRLAAGYYEPEEAAVIFQGLDQRIGEFERQGEVDRLFSENTDYQHLLETLKHNIDTPLYDQPYIDRQVGNTVDMASDQFKSSQEGIDQYLAARGTAGSGIQSDLATRNKETMDRAVRSAYLDIPNIFKKGNADYQTGQEQIYQSALQLPIQLKAAAIPNFDYSAVNEGLTHLGEVKAGTAFFNDTLTQSAYRDMQQQIQDMFNNMLSIGGLASSFMGGKGGGGGGGGGGSSGSWGLGIPGVASFGGNF